MNNIYGVLGALGGAAVFIAGVWALVRGIFRQTNATEANTKAIQDLNGSLGDVIEKVEDNRERIARLEGGRGSGSGPDRPRPRRGR